MADRVLVAELIYAGANPVRTAPGKQVYIYKRGLSELAALYAAESGETTVAQPLVTNNAGMPAKNGEDVWIGYGSYDLEVAGSKYPYEASIGRLPESVGSSTPAPGPVFNVIVYGAKGDGTTDDTTAIQAALDAANAIGGGCVHFPKGVYLVSASLVIHSFTELRGDHVANVEIKLKASSNCNVLESAEFAILTETEKAEGPEFVAIRDLIIDGNKANNPEGGHGIAYYGTGPDFRNLIVRNCKERGVHSEWGSAAERTDGVTGRLADSQIHNNGTDGVFWGGPHDSFLSNTESFLNGAKGFWIANHSAITEAVACHSWGLGQTYAWYLESETHLLGCQGEGATTGQVMIGHNDCSILGGKYFGILGHTQKGFLLGDSEHEKPSGLKIDTRTYNCLGAALDFTHAYTGSNQSIRVINFQEEGTKFVGSPPTEASYELIGFGVEYGLNVPGRATFRAGAEALNIVGNNTKFQFNGSSGTFYTVNGAIFRGYGDNFLTQTFGISAATGGIQPGTTAGLGAHIYSGSGAPNKPGGINPTVGDVYLRTDKSGSAGERIYICTTGGAEPVWAGIA